MKRKSILGMVAGSALLASLWTGTAQAAEEFSTLSGISAETISNGEMAGVEGKFLVNPLPLLGSSRPVTLNTSAIGVKGKMKVMGQKIRFSTNTKKGQSSVDIFDLSAIAGSLNVPFVNGQLTNLPVIDGLPVLSGLQLANPMGLVGALPVAGVVPALPLGQVTNPSGLIGSLPVAGQLPILSTLSILR
ncbi:MAG: hypothetical protein ACREQ3_22045 [Candidatus Binatia bacterium]